MTLNFNADKSIRLRTSLILADFFLQCQKSKTNVGPDKTLSEQHVRPVIQLYNFEIN